MLTEILVFVVTSLGAYFVYQHERAKRQFRRKAVRFLPGVPLLGNTLRSTLATRHVLEDLDEVYKAFPDDKYVGYMDNTKPVLLIRDPELIKLIAIKDFDHFTDHPILFDEELNHLFGGSLLFLKGDKWRHMRNTLSPAFTSSKMRHVMPLIQDITNNIVEYLREHQTDVIDVEDLMHRYTNDVIASTAFGLQINSLKDRDNEFYNIGINIFNFDWKAKVKALFMMQFPILAKKLLLQFFPQSIQDFFKNLVSSSMEYRDKEKVERKDMIHLLMEAKTEWTLDDLTSQVFIFFIAGFETSASALTMCIHELAINPEVQERLYQEVRRHEDDKKLQYDNINEVKYLDCVLSESLRKWAPAIILDRVCVKTYEFPPPRDGAEPVKLIPGDVVYKMVNSIHMDPKYFPSPEKFDPNRFSEENKHHIKPFTYMPFGLGPRNCIGMRIALLELKVLLYHLILNFRIVKCAKTDDPIVLKPHVIKIRSVGGTWVRFDERLTQTHSTNT